MERLQPSSRTLRSYGEVLSRGIIALALAHFTTHLLEFALPPLYPLLMEEFSLSYAQVGFISSSIVMALFIFQAPIGHLSDRRGRKYLLLSFILLLIIATFSTGFSPSYSYVLLFQILVGIGASAYHSAGMALASDIAPSKKIGRFMAVQGFGGTMGVAAAPFVVGILGEMLGWRGALRYSALGGVPLLLVVVWLFKTSANTSDSQETREAVLPRIVIALILLGFLLQGFVFRGLVSFFPTYVVDVHKGSLQLAGLLTSLLFFSGAVAELFGGEWADRTDKINVMAASYGLRFFLLFAITHVYDERALPLLILAYGFSDGMAIPATVSIMREMSPTHAAGRSYGIIFSINTLMGFFSPLIMGYLADVYNLGFSFSLLVTVLLLSFAFITLARYFKHKNMSAM